MGGGATKHLDPSDVVPVLQKTFLASLSEATMTAMSKSLKRVSVKPGASIYAQGKHARGDLFIVDEGTLELVAKADGKRIRSYQTGDLIGLCEMMADVKGGEDCTDVVANGSAALLALSKKDYTKMARASQLEPWAAAVDDALKRAHADRCVKLLRNVDFFARLSDEELSLLTPLGSFVAAKPGTIALEQDVCDPALYIVLSGALSVCVKIDDDEMKEHDLAIFRTHAAAEAESLTQKAMRAGIAADAIEDVRARGLTINVGATSEVGSLKPGDFMGEVSLLESLLKPGGEPPCFRTSASVVVQEQALFMKFDSDELARTIAAHDAGNPEPTRIESRIKEVFKRRCFAHLGLFKLPFFTGLEASGLEALEQHAELAMYRPGQCIFKTGDGGEHFYIACAGQVNLSVPDTDNPDNPQTTIELVVKGEYFGERALVSDEPRAATAIATSPSILVRFSVARFRELFLKDPVFAAEFEVKTMEKKCSLQAIMAHPDGNRAFLRFLEQNHAAENHRFLTATARYRNLGGGSVEEARLIMDEFVKDGAPSGVNLGSKTRRAVEAAFNAGEIDAALFSGAEKDIAKMTTKDAFARFKKSDGFQELLLAIGAYKSRNERSGL